MEDNMKQQLQSMTEGLDQWCDRRQQRRVVARQRVLLCVGLLITAVLAMAMMPGHEGTWVQGSRAEAPEVAIESVTQMLLMS